ncbi:ABC transporter ATP-binding protein [Clostridium thailandense]|uniref:ABC transporter ATP-binding protein n=1 Tax=Clostridium thailandense TaxID=2794346 RepID=UPI003988EBC2
MERNIIEVKGLSKSFGKRLVVDNVNLTVKEGDIYGFLGQNGSGKTTTIRMLLNLIHPDNGNIKLNTYDLKKNFHKAIEKVGAIVEMPKFYNYLSGRKNLELMANLIPNIKDGKVDEVLEMVGMLNRAKDKVKTYSLGMRQRLGIANALLNDPKLIILDEPTNGLDPQGMKEIRDMIYNLAVKNNITFFISTHLLHEVEQVCNKVAILHQGRILAEGNVADMLNLELEIIDVYTPSPDRMIDIIKDCDYIKSYEKLPKCVRVKMEKGFSAKLNYLLAFNNLEVQYLIPQSQSLESVFIKLTGGMQID